MLTLCVYFIISKDYAIIIICKLAKVLNSKTESCELGRNQIPNNNYYIICDLSLILLVQSLLSLDICQSL